MANPSRSTRTLIERVFSKIPADVIGEVYCDRGGPAFFETMAPRIIEDGCDWGGALAKRLGSEPGCSFYVGAGLAELPAMLTEALDLGRRVVAVNLRADECECLNEALHRAEVDRRALRLREGDAREIDPGAPVSHVSLVSVLTDPETYPTVSGVGYGRIPPVLLDLKAFERERKSARALVEAVLGRLTLPGLVTTTGEETPWIIDWARAREVDFEVDDLTLPAAVVGDPIGFLRLRQA